MIKIIEEDKIFYEALKSDNVKDFLDGFEDIFKFVTVPIYLITTGDEYKKYLDCPKSFVNTVYKSTQGKKNPVHYITTDLLTVYWGDWVEDLKLISDYKPFYHEPKILIKSSIPLKETSGISRFGDEYSGFLSDWKEYPLDNIDIKEQLIRELSSHGYIM